jgi:hypothetical protein
MHRLLRSMIYIGAACAIVPSTGLLAQGPSGPPAVATAHKTHWCFRGRPKPTCDNFWLTELGFAKSVTSDSASTYTWELGWMVNRGTRHALGVGVFFQALSWVGDFPDPQYKIHWHTGFGIRPRLRLWMSRAISVDLAPGIILFDWGGAGFSGHVGLNLGDYAAVTAHVVSRPHAHAPSAQTGVLVGGRVGSAVGAIVGGAWLVFLAILSSDDS